jgi:hypothetical protein
VNREDGGVGAADVRPSEIFLEEGAALIGGELLDGIAGMDSKAEVLKGLFSKGRDAFSYEEDQDASEREDDSEGTSPKGANGKPVSHGT